MKRKSPSPVLATLRELRITQDVKDDEVSFGLSEDPTLLSLQSLPFASPHAWTLPHQPNSVRGPNPLPRIAMWQVPGDREGEFPSMSSAMFACGIYAPSLFRRAGWVL